jgi:hypothetical protein
MAITVVITSLLAFAFLATIHFSVFDGGVDSGCQLITNRFWVKLSRVRNFNTHSIDTPIGAMIYAILYFLFHSPNIIAFLSLNLFIQCHLGFFVACSHLYVPQLENIN